MKEIVLLTGSKWYLVAEDEGAQQLKISTVIQYRSEAEGRSLITGNRILGFQPEFPESCSAMHGRVDSEIGTYWEIIEFRDVRLTPRFFEAPNEEALRESLRRVMIVFLATSLGYET